MTTYIDHNILNQLNDAFLKNIKIISIFGHKVSEVLIVTKDDTVFGFGENHSGVLGFGHNNQVKEMRIIKELSGKRIISFANGVNHVIGLTISGKIYSWGKNQCSQLGNEMRDNNCHKPEINQVLNKEVIVQVSCGAFHSLVLTEKNELYSWGSNQYGEIGNESKELLQSVPVKLKALNDGSVIAISCGYSHSLSLTDKGFVYGWGDNEWGQLGIEDNDRTHNMCKTKPLKITKPNIVKVKNDYKPDVQIVQICCGSRHSMLLSRDGEIYTFGENTFGQIGNNSYYSQVTPRIINSAIKYKTIASYFRYNISIALSVDDIFYVWGKLGEKSVTTPKESELKSINDILLHYNRITHESFDISDDLEKIIHFSLHERMIENNSRKDINNEIIQIEHQSNHLSLLFKPNTIAKYKFREQTQIEANFNQNLKLLIRYCDRDDEWPYDILGTNVLFVTENGRVYAIGRNCNKFTDFYHINTINKPTFVKELWFKGVIHFTYGINHVIARTNKNKLYIWGSNEFGQLGNETNDNCFVPRLVKNLSEINIVDISCGGWHSLALTDSGEVYSWGWNKYGQIGNESENSCQLTPSKIEKFNKKKIISISCGPLFSMALTDSGNVYSWGKNDCGQLGFTKILYSNIPKRIKIKNDNKIKLKIKKISCGNNHSLLLTTDGDIYGFGSNSFGQLANDCLEDHFIPTKIRIEKKFINIASHSCCNISAAISVDKIYYVWGCFGKSNITKPEVTHFDSFNAIFLGYYGISYCKTQPDIPIINGSEEKKYKSNFQEFGLIASGNYGLVSKAKSINENKIYAIKRIALNAKNKNSVLREFEIMSQLDSNFVVKVKSFWIEDNYLLKESCEQFKDDRIESLSGHKVFDPNNDSLLHIQMEYCFKSLKEIIEMMNNELNSNNEKIITQIHYYISSQLSIEVLECVDYLHKQNPPIIHRDLKPANILITHGFDGRFVKLCDFGLAKLHEFDGQSHTTCVGTFKYMAPEVFRAQKYNTESDIYSIAVVIQELIKDFKEQIEAEPDSTFVGKYKDLLVLVLLMMKEDQELRPNCESILNQKSSWALSISDIENNPLLEEISNNWFSIEDNFHSFFIKKKLEISKQLQSDKSDYGLKVLSEPIARTSVVEYHKCNQNKRLRLSN